MATLVLAAAGGALGSSVGGTFLGVSAEILGQAAGAALGRVIDYELLGPSQSAVSGPRLDSARHQVSREGADLPVIEGRARVAGSIIWSTRLNEVESSTTTTTGGGKKPKVQTTETNFSYFANFAVALADCQSGALAHLGRVWADGKLLDLSTITHRFYRGTEDQNPDPLITAKDGAAPAYRGTAYIVFENFPVEKYGRRIPQMNFEVWGPPGDMEKLVEAVNIIPASTEFGYSPSSVTRGGEVGATVGENTTRGVQLTDWHISIGQMADLLPATKSAALIVSWFGDDLRAGHCTIAPRVESKTKETAPAWSVAGLTRAAARLVTEKNGGPAFGSSPDDQSVIDAIIDLRARGIAPVFYPFIMMDIEKGNVLPDPATGAPGQAAYPWRGRIVPSAGSISADVDTFFNAGTWNYRHFILHMADLAARAGGVDAFLIGSELRGLTFANDAPGQYPAVDELVRLAGEVKAILPAAKISYAADWSEYHSHRVDADVYFHLDPLWSSPAIDFIGIDNYLPLSDWRNGTDHADLAAGTQSIYDLDYLKSQIEGGEYFDYYYQTEADRAAQIRTPITDGAYSEPWIYRQKAIRDWWANPHHNRPGGIRSPGATGWIPQSKPVWFTEFGCAAINLAPNQPNVFYDPASSESALPHYSNAARDDFMARQYIRAMLEFWRDHGGAMLDPSKMFLWAWDARPWPEFPHNSELWNDAPNYKRGHWLNGRAGNAPAAEVIRRRLQTYYKIDAARFDVSSCYGQADGFVISGAMGFRDLISNFETALRLDIVEDGGVLKFKNRADAQIRQTLKSDDLVEGEMIYKITRASPEDLPRAALVRYLDTDRDYEPGAARAAIQVAPGQAEAVADLALVSDEERMTNVARMLVRSAEAAAEVFEFSLPASSDLLPGDGFKFIARDGTKYQAVIENITRGLDHKISARQHAASAFASAPGPARPAVAVVSPASSTVAVVFLDLPLLPTGTAADHQGYAALTATPWPGGGDLWRSIDAQSGFKINLRAPFAAKIGKTTTATAAGRLAVWSTEVLTVEMAAAGFITRPDIDILAGDNGLALEHPGGNWEVLQFKSAALIAPDLWQLTGLLRGQLGTEAAAANPVPAGARVVVLDKSITPINMAAADIGRPYYWRAAPSGSDAATATAPLHTFQGIGRRPFAPVHLRTTRLGDDLSISWIRRGRIESDVWPDSGDIPIGEVSEKYQVEMISSGAVLHSQIVTETDADFDISSTTGPLTFRVCQISETYGPGAPAQIEINL